MVSFANYNSLLAGAFFPSFPKDRILGFAWEENPCPDPRTLAFLGEKSMANPQKSKGSSLRGTLKSLEKKGKRHTKSRKIGKQKSKENKKSKDWRVTWWTFRKFFFRSWEGKGEFEAPAGGGGFIGSPIGGGGRGAGRVSAGNWTFGGIPTKVR